MTQQSLRSRILSFFTWLAAKVRRHPFLWLGGTALLVGVFGWAVGTWSTCGPQCGFDAALFSAWGGWVGGLATTAAFGVTAYELVSSRHREEKAKLLRAEEVLTRARNVTYKFLAGPKQRRTAFGVEPTTTPEIEIRVSNRSRSPITDVVVLFGAPGKEIGKEDQLNPIGDQDSRIKGWRLALDPADLGVEVDPSTRAVSPTEVDNFSLEFSMEGYRFRRHESEIEIVNG